MSHPELPTKVYLAEKVREMDRIAIEEFGVNGFELMQRASRAAFHKLLKRWPQVDQITVLCGGGNNGGDGYVLAGLAGKRGIAANILFLSSPDKLKGDAKRAYEFSQQYKIPCEPYSDTRWQALGLDQASEQERVIVDAMLGTGLNAEVRGDYRQAIENCNTSPAPVLGIDIPSGLSADTGQALGLAIKADCTITFIGMKLGLLTGQGRAYCGEIFFDDLEVPAGVGNQFTPDVWHHDLPDLLSALLPRDRDTHKGHCGHLLLIGGDHGFGGAILMAAQAAARMGAGLVTVATQAEHCAPMLARQPEVMVRAVSSIHELEPLLHVATAIVVGPGLGQSPWSQQMLMTALKHKKPVVLDADALNLLTQHPNWLDAEQSQHILTPHPGEAARMLNTDSRSIQADRLEAARQLQQRWRGTIVLKGSGTLVAHPDESVNLCTRGNPGMASGGMGDVLSGILGGLLVQGLERKFAVNLGVALHAGAADLAAEVAGERGLLATDLISPARKLLNKA